MTGLIALVDLPEDESPDELAMLAGRLGLLRSYEVCESLLKPESGRRTVSGGGITALCGSDLIG